MDYEVRAVLKCRSCKINAKGLEVDGVVTLNEMRSDLDHRFTEQKGREILYRDVLKIPDLRQTPSDHGAQGNNPWPFELEAGDQG